MAIETKCQTPGCWFHTNICSDIVEFNVTLPFNIELSEEETKLLEANLHNVVELAYAKYFVPKYEHDCTSCEYLGSYTYDAPLVQGTERLTADLWCCPTCVGGPSLIARYGSNGPEYASAPISIVERHFLPRSKSGERMSTMGPAIVEAYHRWKGKKRTDEMYEEINVAAGFGPRGEEP